MWSRAGPTTARRSSAETPQAVRCSSSLRAFGSSFFQCHSSAARTWPTSEISRFPSRCVHGVPASHRDHVQSASSEANRRGSRCATRSGFVVTSAPPRAFRAADVESGLEAVLSNFSLIWSADRGHCHLHELARPATYSILHGVGIRTAQRLKARRSVRRPSDVDWFSGTGGGEPEFLGGTPEATQPAESSPVGRAAFAGRSPLVQQMPTAHRRLPRSMGVRVPASLTSLLILIPRMQCRCDARSPISLQLLLAPLRIAHPARHTSHSAIPATSTTRRTAHDDKASVIDRMRHEHGWRSR